MSETTQKEILEKLFATFQVEEAEHLEKIRAFLIRSETEPNTAKKEDFDEIFRRAHSLKGAARAVDIQQVETLAHRLESLFSEIREGKRSLEKKVTQTIHLVLDTIEDVVASLSQHQTPPIIDDALQAIELVLEKTEKNKEPPEKKIAESSPAPPHRIEQPLSPVSPMKASLRIRAESLDHLLQSSGELMGETLRQNSLTQELSSMDRRVKILEKEWDQMKKWASVTTQQITDDQRFLSIARSLDLMGHPLHLLARQARSIRLIHQRNTWVLHQIGERIRENLRQARLVAAEETFQGFGKMVRDLAKDEGKEIEFRAMGLETEADRMVLQTLKDPVMHLLRNTITHGIETPEQREKKGKNRTGQIQLKVSLEGNRLLVSVEDDGQGLDLKLISKTAIQKGLLSEEQAATLSPDELAGLIFQPGCTTMQTIDSLAGRGMGLSVVSEAALRLQGHLHLFHSHSLHQRTSHGIRITLSVPQSVSTHRILLISCQGQTLGFPYFGIYRLLRVKLSEIKTIEGKAVLIHQDETLPLFPLTHFFKESNTQSKQGLTVEGEWLSVIIVKSEEKRIAVVVESFLSEREAFVQELDPIILEEGNFMGGIFLDEGEIALILNPQYLIQKANQTSVGAHFHESLFKNKKKDNDNIRTPTILVVDDSITTRTLEKSILEAHGYQVKLAVDGIEALVRLRAEPIDLAVVDVEMPRMDGLTLIGEMKKNKKLSNIPVIIVSSLEKKEEKEKGLALGAEAYITKRKFDHRDLLETIVQLLP